MLSVNCGKAFLWAGTSKTQRPPGISCCLSTTGGGGNSTYDAEEFMLKGVAKECGCAEVCGVHWGVCGTGVWAVIILSRMSSLASYVSNFASCLANEHSSLPRMVLNRRSSSHVASERLPLSWFNCCKRISHTYYLFRIIQESL